MAGGNDIGGAIHADMRAKILRLDLEPGLALSEAEVCRMYGASRTPVRTAMNRLADSGLIEISPYQGARVRLIDLSRARQLIYGRVALEVRVLIDFSRTRDELAFEDMDHAIRRQEILLSGGDVDSWDFHELDTQLHDTWFRAMGKMAVWNLFRADNDYVRLKFLEYRLERDYELIIEEHKRIAAAVRDGDEEKMGQALGEHVMDHLEGVMAKVSSDSEWFA